MAMKFRETFIPSVFVIEVESTVDSRGTFSRIYCKREFSEIGFSGVFVQINQSYNLKKGTFRGFHYQISPQLETKLIRCISGSVMDIAVDVRKGSSTFLKHVAVELSSENGKMMLIPPGVAHGFVTLTDDATLIYHHDQFYAAGNEQGIRSNDPLINFQLPVPVSIFSDRDLSHPLLAKSFVGIEVTKK